VEQVGTIDVRHGVITGRGIPGKERGENPSSVSQDKEKGDQFGGEKCLSDRETRAVGADKEGKL
jgi:hypothetical protein